MQKRGNSNVWHAVPIHFHHYKFVHLLHRSEHSCQFLLVVVIVIAIVTTVAYLKHYDVLHIYCIIIRLGLQWRRFHFILDPFLYFPSLSLSHAKLTAINVNVDTGNAIARYWRATTIAETMLWTYENIWKRPIVWTGFISISFVFKLFALPHCIR